MDIQFSVTILLIYTQCLNNTLAPSGKILMQCLPAAGTPLLSPAGSRCPCSGRPHWDSQIQRPQGEGWAWADAESRVWGGGQNVQSRWPAHFETREKQPKTQRGQSQNQATVRVHTDPGSTFGSSAPCNPWRFEGKIHARSTDIILHAQGVQTQGRTEASILGSRGEKGRAPTSQGHPKVTDTTLGPKPRGGRLLKEPGKAQFEMGLGEAPCCSGPQFPAAGRWGHTGAYPKAG